MSNAELIRIYEEVRKWPETREERLRQLLIVDEPILFRECMPIVERIVTLLRNAGMGRY